MFDVTALLLYSLVGLLPNFISDMKRADSILLQNDLEFLDFTEISTKFSNFSYISIYLLLA